MRRIQFVPGIAVSVCLLFASVPCASAATIAVVPVRAGGVEEVDWFLGAADNEIVLLHGGQDVMFDVMISGYGPEEVAAYQATLDCGTFSFGTFGTLAAISDSCATAGDFQTGFCLGVDVSRPNFLLAGTSEVIDACQSVVACPNGEPGAFACGAIAIFGASGPDDGSEYYAATFSVHVPSAAEGSVDLGLLQDTNFTFMQAPFSVPIPVDQFVPGTVKICPLGDDCTPSNCPAGFCCDPITGVEVEVDDGVPCTQDECQDDGTVSHTDYLDLGYCCNPLDGSIELIDDDRPCTKDVCLPDGTVVHEDIEFCEETLVLIPTRASGEEGVDWIAGPGGNEITLLQGGQQLEVKVYAQGFGPDQVTAYQVTLDCASFDFSIQGSLVPIDTDCTVGEGEFGVDFCLGVDESEPTYILAEAASTLPACDVTTACTNGEPGRFACGAVAIDGDSGPDNGGLYYLATLAFDIDEDALGAFSLQLDLDPNLTFLKTPMAEDVPIEGSAGANGSIPTGRCCGIASEPLLCGDGYLIAECIGAGGVWSIGEVCAGVSGDESIDLACPCSSEDPDVDIDGDGIALYCDACPDSLSSATVRIGTCETDVQNVFVVAGCNLLDELSACVPGPQLSYNQEVALDIDCVTALVDTWVSEGLVGEREGVRIIRCVE